MLSILTATFNRAHTLPRLRRSLLEQRDQDFEWIIVDDGSTDGTVELLAQWMSEGAMGFAVHCLRTENAGKHLALNRAVEAASGELCFIVDSDDWLDGSAVLNVNKWSRETVGREEIAGVAGLKDLGSRSDSLPLHKGGDFAEASNRERKALGLIGDLGAEAYRRDLLLRFPFPSYPGEKFLHEGLVWNRIADAGYRLRWHPVVIYHAEYQKDGLSARAAQLHQANFQGYSAYVRELIPPLGSIERFRVVGAYAAVARSLRLSRKAAAEQICVSPVTLVVAGACKAAYDAVRGARVVTDG